MVSRFLPCTMKLMRLGCIQINKMSMMCDCSEGVLCGPQQQFDRMSRDNTIGSGRAPLVLWCLLVVSLMVAGVDSWCFDTVITQFNSAAEIDFSFDNNTFLAVDSGNKLVNFWRMDTKELVFTYPTAPQTPTSAKFSKDGNYIGIGESNGDIIILYANYSYYLTISGVMSSVVQLDFSWITANSLTACSNNQLKFFYFNTTLIWSITGNSGYTSCKMNKLDGIGYSFSKTMAWHVFNNPTPAATDTKGSSNNYYEVDFSMDNSSSTSMRLVSGNVDSNFYSLTNGQTSASNNNSVSNNPSGICYSKDNNYIGVAENGGGNSRFYIMNATNRYDTFFQSFSDTSSFGHCRFNYNTKYAAATSNSNGNIYIYTTNCIANKCSPGSYDNNGVCASCASIGGCITCTSAAICTACAQGFYLLSNACSPCNTITACRSCESSSKCTECQQGYFLNYSSNACVLCENSIKGCLSCDRNSTNTTVYCRNCHSEFYLNTTDFLCYSCVTNNPLCLRCHNTSACMECQMGYYLDSSLVCQLCTSNCLVCVNSTTCISCIKGYYANSGSCSTCGTNCLDCQNTGICVSCARGSFLNSGACTACTLPCLTCSTSATYCLTCPLGFYSNGAGACLRCTSQCVSCNATNFCNACEMGYYLTNSNTCSSCSIFPNCTTCNSTECFSCQSSFYLNSTRNCQTCLSSLTGCLSCSTSTTCAQCFVGYYLNAGNTCTACPSQCESCTSSSSCLNCAVGYYLSTTTCTLCPSPCVSCSSSTNCLSCQTGYYLNTSATPNVCTKCLLNLLGCLSCSSSSTCIECQLGRYLSAGSCSFCPANCSTCNSTTCLGCSVGYYLTGSTCSKCQENCSECTSATNCWSCNTGYYYNSSLATNNCVSCIGLGCETCNVNGCLTCPIGYYLSSTSCLTCNITFTNCYACSETLCIQCMYGYYSNAGACTLCVSALNGCASCANNSACNECTVGYYLTGTNNCASCPVQCKTCKNNVCTTCQIQYTFNTGSTDCILCEIYMDACLTCSSNSVCTGCYEGFYLSANACLSCRSNMIGCLSCFNSSTCAVCQDQYYLVNGVCTNCKSIQACTYCQNSSVCLSCLSGYYLNAGNTCSLCTASLVGCLFCASSSTCRQCQTGYFLNTGTNQCQLCVNSLQGCLSCVSSTTCSECDGGYYLDTGTFRCKSCNVVGCQVCGATSPSVCISCSLGYYLTGTTCTACAQNGCLECTAAATCVRCDSGYYLSGSTCSSCKPTINACSKCVNATVCTQCDSTYYLNSSNLCSPCSSTLDSCEICSSSTSCTVCSSGYYSAGGICTSCSSIAGCFMCISASSCQNCVNGYYLLGTTCTICSSAIANCYECSSSSTCLSCISGYVLSSGVCTAVVAGSSPAPQPIPMLEVKTYYVSSTVLKHILYTKQGYGFSKQTMNWTTATTISLYNSASSSTISLTISSVEWGSGLTSIIFFTNNPLNISADSLSMPFARLLLTVQDMSMSYQTKFQMTQQALALLMPDQVIPNDFTQQGPLMEPTFYMSYLQTSGQFYYSIFGFVIIAALFLNFFVRATCTASHSRNIGEIVPHILALKTCVLMVFPIYPQLSSFCYGMMAADLPWLSQYYVSTLSYAGDVQPAGFQLFYINMNFASVYLSAFVLCLLLLLLGYLSITKVPKQHQAFTLKADEEENRSSYAYLRVIFLYFSFGITFAGSASIQGALYNPSDSLSVNGAFYMLGGVVYCVQLAVTVYLTKRESRSCYLRSFLKATFLSVAHISPIYICTLVAGLDMAILVLQYKRHKQDMKYAKVWVVKHVLANISLVLLYYYNEKRIVLLTVVAISFLSILIEFCEHIGEGSAEEPISKRVKPVGSGKERAIEFHDEKNETLQYFGGDLKIGKDTELVEPAFGDTRTTFQNSKGFTPDFIFDEENNDSGALPAIAEKMKSPKQGEKRHRPFRTMQRKKEVKIEPILEKDDSSRNESPRL